MPSTQDVAWALKLPEKVVKSYLDDLIASGLFSVEESGDVTPHDWDELQFESDTSRARQKAYRDRHKHRHGDVTVTVQEQSRAEQIQSRAEEGAASDADIWFEGVYARHPKKRDRILAQQAIVTAMSSGKLIRDDFDRAHKAWCLTDSWKEKNGQFCPSLAAWIQDDGYKFMPEGNPVKPKKIKPTPPTPISSTDPDEMQFSEWRKQTHGY